MLKNADQHEVSQLEKSLILLSDASRQHGVFIKKQFKVSALEMQLIQFVIMNGPQKMKDVSEHFHIKLSTFTSIIDKAEKLRILKRINSKEDRRVVFLDATAKGRKLYDRYSESLGDMVKQVESDFSSKQFKQFVEGLEAFNEISLSQQ